MDRLENPSILRSDFDQEMGAVALEYPCTWTIMGELLDNDGSVAQLIEALAHEEIDAACANQEGSGREYEDEVQIMATGPGKSVIDNLIEIVGLAIPVHNEGRVEKEPEICRKLLEPREAASNEIGRTEAATASNPNSDGGETQSESSVSAVEIQLRILRTIEDLGEVCRSKIFGGDYAEIAKEVVDKRIASFSKSHSSTLQAIQNCRNVYWEQGLKDEVVLLEERVLDVRIRDLGEEHSDTMNSMRDLAITYWNQGWAADAIKLQERLLKVRRLVLGQQHHRVLIAGVNLAMMYCNESSLDKAKKLNEQLLNHFGSS